jgi:hypothetical protein
MAGSTSRSTRRRNSSAATPRASSRRCAAAYSTSSWARPSIWRRTSRKWRSSRCRS